MPDEYRQPTVSPEFVSDTGRVARQIELDHPNNPQWLEHAAALRRSVQGLAPAPEVDSRTPEQRHYDQHHGLTVIGGAPQIPPYLREALENDTTPADAKAVAAQLEAIDRDYAVDLVRAQQALAGTKIDAKNLSARSLANLCLWHEQAAKIAASRPK
jgi:hypothetical protein